MVTYSKYDDFTGIGDRYDEVVITSPKESANTVNVLL